MSAFFMSATQTPGKESENRFSCQTENSVIRILRTSLGIRQT